MTSIFTFLICLINLQSITFLLQINNMYCYITLIHWIMQNKGHFFIYTSAMLSQSELTTTRPGFFLMQVAKAFLIVLTLLLWCWLFGLWITGHIQKAHHKVPVIFWSLHTTLVPPFNESFCVCTRKIKSLSLWISCHVLKYL